MAAITEDSTMAEIAEALGHLVAAARIARDPRIYDVMHRRINHHLDAMEMLYGFEPVPSPLVS